MRLTWSVARRRAALTVTVGPPGAAWSSGTVRAPHSSPLPHGDHVTLGWNTTAGVVEVGAPVPGWAPAGGTVVGWTG